MTILPPVEKLKILLEKVKDFHIKFLEKYAWNYCGFSAPHPLPFKSNADNEQWCAENVLFI